MMNRAQHQMRGFLFLFGFLLLVILLENNHTVALSVPQVPWRHAFHTRSIGRNTVFGGGMLFWRLGSVNNNSEQNCFEIVDHSNVIDDILIEDAYRKAQESDEDWYAMIMSDMFGVESIDDRKKASGKFESVYVEREDDDTITSDQGLNSFCAGPNEMLKTSANSTLHGASRFTSMAGKDSRRTDERRHGTDDNSEEYCGERSSRVSFSKNKSRDFFSANDEMNPEGFAMLRFVDQRGRHKTIEVDALIELGYRWSDIQRLRSIAVEKIVKSGLQKPKRGIPRNWIVLSKSPEIDFIRKSAKLQRVTKDGSKRRPQSLPKEARQLPGSGGNIGIEIGERKRVSAFKQGSSDTFRSSTDDKFWMDVRTFTSYLRKEAQLRLSILGPSWSDAVKGESRWRLKIYKNWLVMINDAKRERPIRSKRRGRRRATTEVEGVRSKRGQGKKERRQR